jgi:hypothetical protein
MSQPNAPNHTKKFTALSHVVSPENIYIGLNDFTARKNQKEPTS